MTRFFPSHFPDNSLTVNNITDISLTCFKFPDISRFSSFSRQVVTLITTTYRVLSMQKPVHFGCSTNLEWRTCFHPKPTITTVFQSTNPISKPILKRHRLRSTNRHRLIVLRCQLNTYGRRAFPVAGPTVWNSLPDELRDPACNVDSFKQFFKIILFSSY